MVISVAYKGSGKKARIQGSGQKRSSYGKKQGGFEAALGDLFKPAKKQTKKTHHDSIKSNRNPKR